MQNARKKLKLEIPRPVLIVTEAVVVALALTLIPRQQAFRNRLSDALIIEALLLFITSWLSHLKSGKLAFITFHPFKKKAYPQDWKDRIPKLGSPPFSMEATEKALSPEESSKKEKIALRFRRDLVFAGAALLAIGLIVQYV